MDLIFLLAMNGLVWGLIIALIALGLSIILGLLDVINIAHGDFFMLGAVGCWFVLAAGLPFWVALILVPLVGLAFGALVQQLVIKPVQVSPSLSIVATFGLSLILQESVRATFGAAPQRISPPVSGTVELFGVNYDVYRLVAAGFASAVLAGFFIFLNKTKFGTRMRAVRLDKDMAIALGIPSNQIFMATFAIGASVAMVGGIVASPITSIEFRLGIDILPLCFMAVIIGGLGNLPGTVAAAVLISVTEGVLTAFVEPTGARIATLLFMCVVLLVRPQGLFSRG
ncbi:MAG: branched-chain amino acid ABC transporter permease [Rhodobacteraceae bacterium]|nr:branched-chain amino acid ABC transporter permease [Paracoccaceae bacterium]